MTDAAERKAATLARVAETFGTNLVAKGGDAFLPDGRKLVTCWSKPHHGGRDYYVGLPNRLNPGDALIVGLGDDDVVFPVANWLLQYAPMFSRSNDGRPIPRFVRHGDQPFLNVGNQTLSLAGFVDNYTSLLANKAIDELPMWAGTLSRPFKRPKFMPSKPREPFSVDPDEVDRATAAHGETLAALAYYVEGLGAVPHEWIVPQPRFDLAWMHQGVMHVAEVKSTTRRNEERQLRLGLGQVLRYRQTLASVTNAECKAVLCVEHRPRDDSWPTLCADLGVVLVWPPEIANLMSAAHQ